MHVTRFRFQLSHPARLATLRATLRLFYTSHPRAFVTSSIASLFEPLFYPALLLLLHQLLQEVIGSGSTVRFTTTVAFVGLGLVERVQTVTKLVQVHGRATREKPTLHQIQGHNNGILHSVRDRICDHFSI